MDSDFNIYVKLRFTFDWIEMDYLCLMLMEE